jgi:hypothetical protein
MPSQCAGRSQKTTMNQRLTALSTDRMFRIGDRATHTARYLHTKMDVVKIREKPTLPDGCVPLIVPMIGTQPDSRHNPLRKSVLWRACQGKRRGGDSLNGLPRHPAFCDKPINIRADREFQDLLRRHHLFPVINAYATKPPQMFCQSRPFPRLGVTNHANQFFRTLGMSTNSADKPNYMIADASLLKVIDPRETSRPYCWYSVGSSSRQRTGSSQRWPRKSLRRKSSVSCSLCHFSWPWER